MSDRVVIVGASVGGIRAAQGLRSAGFDGEVVVIGAETVDPYDKPPLSKGLLVGESSVGDVALLDAAELDASGISICLGCRAVEVDSVLKRVTLETGETVAYNSLVIATGARPRQIGVTDNELVFNIRTLADSLTLRNRLLQGGPLVVVGSGFLGAEVASSARYLGIDTTVVESLPHPFSGGVGSAMGASIAELHRRHGVVVHSGTAVATIERLKDGTGIVHLDNGVRLPAAAVLVAIGVVPNTEWLRTSGIELANGVVTDEYSAAAGADDVWAIGDVANWLDVRTGQHVRVEQWTNTVEQAELVAHNIVHRDARRPHVPTPYFWSDQFGVKIQAVGRIGMHDQVDLVEHDTAFGRSTVAIASDAGRLTAAVVLDWPRAMTMLRRAWKLHPTIDEVRGDLEALAGRTPARGAPRTRDASNHQPTEGDRS